MNEILEPTKASPTPQKSLLPEISPATDEDVLAYLRRSQAIASIAVFAEREASILNFCKRFNITVSEDECQAAGDSFRLEHKLLGTSETLAWLLQQRITIEDWSEGIRAKLLAKKLKEFLFGDTVDNHYISDRDRYRRVAISQILCRDLPEAFEVARAIREDNRSFCALALEHSIGKQSQINGGFVGDRFLAELMPEVMQAISDAGENEVVGPIQSKLGYHILRVEKWLPTELNETVREKILDSMFQNWLNERSYLENQVHELKR
jgi:parvulin-like peptidyl-prolyl isomerase